MVSHFNTAVTELVQWMIKPLNKDDLQTLFFAHHRPITHRTIYLNVNVCLLIISVLEWWQLPSYLLEKTHARAHTARPEYHRLHKHSNINIWSNFTHVIVWQQGVFPLPLPNPDPRQLLHPFRVFPIIPIQRRVLWVSAASLYLPVNQHMSALKWINWQTVCKITCCKLSTTHLSNKHSQLRKRILIWALYAKKFIFLSLLLNCQ